MAVDPNAAAIEQQAASGTGIPLAVVHQQAIAESGEQDIATSSAGAQGFWQFLPSTYNSHAAAAGVPQGSWNNVADETKVYIVYMNELLKQEGGSIFKALEAYNAGPGNLQAGAGYASGILAKAGVSQSATSGNPVTTAAAVGIPNPLNIPGDISNAVTGALGGVLSDIAKGLLASLGVNTLKNLFQRLALILFGAMLVFVGIRILSQGGSKQAFNIQTSSSQDESGTVTKSRTVNTPVSRHTAKSVGAGDAIEAAAVA